MTVTLKSGLWAGVLGPLHVERDGVEVDLGGPKQRAVLAMLVAGRGNAVSRDQIIEGVWGEVGSAANRGSFHTYVSSLRAVLGDVIVRAGDTYRLEVDSGSVDSAIFESAVEDARQLLATDPGLAAVSLREALGLWRGRPYADLTDVPGVESEVRRLEELRLAGVELRIDAELASGLHGSLVAELEALAEEHPTRERFRAQHMLALYRSGRQSEALRAYRRTEAFLAEELGVEPSDELRDLELKILQHDESLLGGTGRAVTQRLAFLATDIEGSTRLWDRHPQEMAEVLANHDRILREVVEGGAGGKVFKHTGHGVLAAFPTAVAAVGAAEAALVALAAADWGVAGELRIRVGIDVGEAEVRGGVFFGPPLNRAVRLCSSGHGGQVLISEAVQAEVVASARPGVQFRQLGEYRLRGAVAPERIAQLVFAGLADEFPELRTDAHSAFEERVELVSLPGYEVRERLGEGAFGVVWKAYQPSVGREVAVKMIRPELASQPSFVRRFEAEARTIARLAHPHIVPLIDFWRDTDSAYLVMALMAGGSLAEVMGSDPMDSVAARRILAQVGSALDHAHSQGIVHGDLTPANVLLDGAGNAYLTDFWIAVRLLHPEVVSSMGSTGYRAPEAQTTGPTPEADRFAFAVLAGELLDGAPGLDKVLARGTTASPGDRYPSARSFLANVDRVLGETSEIEPSVVSRNPYKGLRAFDVADAADFHGREELVAALLAAVSQHRWATVVGPSGSGKSSVVQAGLLPALAGGMIESSEHWLCAVLTPGSNPLDALVEALETVSTETVDVDRLVFGAGLGAVVDEDLLLVIDQFEEVYTLADQQQRKEFLDLVVDAVEAPDSRVRVVATLRADFYDRPLEDHRLGRLVRDGQVTVLPPSGDELLEMITAPAQTVGLQFEPGLAYQIAEDVAHQPGGLPLLQYALTEVVEHRGSNLLTTADYTRVGGVSGALVTRAESIYHDLSPTQQDTARQVLLRMVTVDEETDDTRRRVRRTELESLDLPRADLDTVLDTFTAERLLLTDRDPATRGPTVEVAHEALLREWPRFQTWVDDQRDSLILARRFRAALADWEANATDDDYLLTGSRLAPYIGWAEAAALTPDEMRFYQASKTRDEAKHTARRRRRRTLTSTLVGATIIASSLGVAAGVQASRAASEAQAARVAEDRAEQERDRATAEANRALAAEAEARAERDRARASELSAFATATLTFDPTLAKLLGFASYETWSQPSLETISVLRRALAEDPKVGRYVWPGERDVGFLWTHVSPDGTKLVAAGCGCAPPSTYLEVFDLEEDKVLWSFDEVKDRNIFVDSPLFSPTGETVVAGLWWFGSSKPTVTARSLGVYMWDAATGEILRRFDLGRCGGTTLGVSRTHIVTDLVLAEEGGCFYDGMPPPALQLIELETGARRILTTQGFIVRMSGDGRYVVYDDGTVTPSVWAVEDVLTGERVLEVEATVIDHPGPVLSHDGSLMVIPGSRMLHVWDVAAGEMIGTFHGHPAGVWTVIFSAADDGTVFSVGRSGSLLHWDARSTQEIGSYPAVGNGWISMADTGLVVVTDQTARTASLIQTRSRGGLWAVDADIGSCFAVASSLGVGGDHATFSAGCGAKQATVVLDLADRSVVRRVDGATGQASRISPDGTRFVRAETGERPLETGHERWVGSLKIRDVRTSEMLAEFQGICTWDAALPGPEEQEGCSEFPGTPFPVWPVDLSWSPDGSSIAVLSGYRPVVSVWDTDSGELLSVYDDCRPHRSHGGIYYDGIEVVFFCDERGASPRIVILDAATGEEIRSEGVGGMGADALAIAGFTPDAPDGKYLVAVRGFHGAGGGSLLWLDEALRVEHELPRIHEGSPKSYAMSPSNRLLATGSSDGFVRVWDVVERRQVDEIYVGEMEIQGVVFIDEVHLVVLPQDGIFQVHTLDVAELVDVVRGSLTRAFTETECQRYGFGDDCPSLEERRTRHAGP